MVQQLCWFDAKDVKDLILEFLVSESFFSKKQKKHFLDYYTIILVSLPLGGCVDEVVNS